MLQYKIPQNVGIEDKIVGPLSLRQLIIIFAGGGISYVIFAIMGRLYELNALEYFVISIPALIALAAALIKVHNVSFTKYLLLLLEFSINPKKRMWDHRGISALVDPDLTNKAKVKKKEGALKMEDAEGRKNLNLTDLSATLDSGGFAHLKNLDHKDIDAVGDDDLITEAYFGNKRNQSSTENMYWRTRNVQKQKLNLLAKIEAAQKKPVIEVKAEVKAPAEVEIPVKAAVQVQKVTMEKKSPDLEKNKFEKTVPEKKPETISPSLVMEKQDPAKPQAEEVGPLNVPKKMIEKSAPAQQPEINEGKASKPVEPTIEAPLKTQIDETQIPEAPLKKEENAVVVPNEVKSEPTTVAPKIKNDGVKTSPKKNEDVTTTPSVTEAIQTKEGGQKTDAPPAKKKRKRKRKKKKKDLPVRPETQVDTTQKNQPAKLIPKKTPTHKDVTLDDLREGSEIEFNLD